MVEKKRTATAEPGNVVQPGKPVTRMARTVSTNTKADEETAKRLAAVRAAILKETGHKTVGEDKSAKPCVSTGSVLLDHLIGGSPAEDGKGLVCPGYPRRHITEIYGAESSGKTTAALEAIVEVQATPGGSAMFIDFEKALSQRYARSIGVSFDPGKLVFIQPDTMEEGWKMLFGGLKAGVDLIVIDSVSAMVPKAELEKSFDDPAKIGAQASAFSIVLPKLMTWLNNRDVSKNPKGTAIIFINQIRATISANAKGDTDNTSGGKALKFYAYLRVKFTKIRHESIKRKDKFTRKERTYNFGQHTQAKIVKSKIDGTNGHTTDLFIRYNHGIDNFYSLIEAGVATRIIQKNGSTLSFNGHEERSKDKFRGYLLNNSAAFEELKSRVLQAVRSDEPVEDLSDEDEIVISMDGLFDGDDTSSTPSVEQVEVESSDFAEEDQAAQDAASDPAAE
jgi:recombination protein RecA